MLAEDLQFELQQRLGQKARVAAAESVCALDSSKLASMQTALFCVACYGSGEPTDDAKKFFQQVMSQTPQNSALHGLHYAVFGLGSSASFPQHYNVVGKQLDEKLAALGASRIVPLGLGDDSGDLEEDFEPWRVSVVQKLSLSFDASPSTQQSQHEVPVPAPSVQPAAELAWSEVEVVRNDELIPDFDGKDEHDSCRHVVFKYSPEQRAELDYSAGDHVAVMPCNSSKVVVDAVDALRNVYPHAKLQRGSSKGQLVEHSELNESILTERIQLTFLPATFIKRMIARADTRCDDTDIQAAQRLLEQKSNIPGLTTVSLSELLSKASTLFAPWSLAEVLEALPSIKPRLYSISSSLAAHPYEIHVTVRWLTFADSRGHRRQGLCSTYLRDLTNGDRVKMCTKPANFHLPSDPHIPLIMVAAGTGIAPFIGFLQELDRRDKPLRAPSVLFYGVRSKQHELYRAELDAALASEALSKLYIAYSQQGLDSAPRFVHEVVASRHFELYELLRCGAHIYVCGGAHGFGQAVRQTFERIASECGLSVAALQAENRIHEDLAD